MTHLLNENEQHEAGSQDIKLWSQYGTSLVQDLNDTFSLFWEQIIRPAFKAIRSTIAVYWPVAFSTPLQSQRIKFANPTRRKVAQTSEAFRKTYGLSLESAIAMRKIQGSLGEDWATAIQGQTRIHQGKANRWADARPKTTTIATKPVMPANNGPSIPSIAAIPSMPAIKFSGTNAPGEHEEIRGLDDIFTGPVKGLFLEETKTAKPQPMVAQTQQGSRSAENMAERAPIDPSIEPEEPIRFNDNVLRKVRWPQVEATASTSAKSGATQPELSLAPPQSDLPQIHQNPQLPSSGNGHQENENAEEISIHWFNRIEGSPDVLAPLPDESPVAPLAQPASDAELTPVLAESNEQADAKDLESDADRDSDSIAADDADAVESAEPSDTETAEKISPESEPAPKPRHLQPVAQAKPEKPETRKLFPDYRPLDEEESGFDHMARNNRILSRSITNLVDSYFQRAAQEEEPNFY